MSKNFIDVKIEYNGDMNEDVARNIKAQLLSYSLFITDGYRKQPDTFDFKMYVNGDEIVEKINNDEYYEEVEENIEEPTSTNGSVILPS